MADAPLISFVVATFNRGSVLIDCLRETMRCGLPEDEFEIIVVDNASANGVAGLESNIPGIRLINLPANQGPVAKNHGILAARGEFIVLMDDDAFPLPGAVRAMLAHFAADDTLGAAVFDVMLPDGTREGSAYPDVFIGAGSGFRRSVLDRVGLLPPEFFMQAEEYDLSFRILAAGFSIRRFADMPLRHLKTPGARVAHRATGLDVRNNLYLLAKYVPAPLCYQLAADWLARYWWMAEARDKAAAGHAHRRAYLAGAKSGMGNWYAQRRRGRILAAETIEVIFKFKQIHSRMAALQQTRHLQRIVLADLGKNMLAYHNAAAALGIEVLAICDDTLASRDRQYRGVPILTMQVATQLLADAWVVSNMSPTQAPRRAAALAHVGAPVIDLFSQPA